VNNPFPFFSESINVLNRGYLTYYEESSLEEKNEVEDLYDALNSWSKWIEEGWFISFVQDDTRYYEHVILRDFAHWEYEWEETILSGRESGPYTPDDLEITRGYDSAKNSNHIWQVIFGIKGQAYIYIENPTDTHRHGIPKRPKPSSVLREVSHFNEWMSPFHEPSFITQQYLIRPTNIYLAISAYNPTSVNITDLRLNFFINKMITERIGTEYQGRLTPTSPKWSETLDKLSRRVIPHKPITLAPVQLPAVAPSGE